MAERRIEREIRTVSPKKRKARKNENSEEVCMTITVEAIYLPAYE